MIPGGSRQLSFQVQLDVKDSTGRTALHCAASRGSQAVTRMLLDAWMHLDIPGLAGTFDDWKRKLNMILLNDFFWGGEPKEFCKGFIMDPFRRAFRRFWGIIFRRFLMLWMVGGWQMCTWDMDHDHCMLIGSYPRLHDVVHNCNVLDGG